MAGIEPAGMYPQTLTQTLDRPCFLPLQGSTGTVRDARVRQLSPGGQSRTGESARRFARHASGHVVDVRNVIFVWLIPMLTTFLAVLVAGLLVVFALAARGSSPQPTSSTNGQTTYATTTLDQRP